MVLTDFAFSVCLGGLACAVFVLLGLALFKWDTTQQNINFTQRLANVASQQGHLPLHRGCLATKNHSETLMVRVAPLLMLVVLCSTPSLHQRTYLQIYFASSHGVERGP